MVIWVIVDKEERGIDCVIAAFDSKEKAEEEIRKFNLEYNFDDYPYELTTIFLS